MFFDVLVPDISYYISYCVLYVLSHAAFLSRRGVYAICFAGGKHQAASCLCNEFCWCAMLCFFLFILCVCLTVEQLTAGPICEFVNSKGIIMNIDEPEQIWQSQNHVQSRTIKIII